MPTDQTPAWGGAAPCWGTPHTQMAWSLKDVMSEQLAHHLDEREKTQHMEELKARTDDFIDIHKLVDMSSGETCDDYLLAQMLQHEFDREHDAFLDKEEQHWNGSSKVKISFKNYRSVHPKYQEEEEDDEDEDEIWEEDDNDEPVPHFNKSGISGKGKNIITKHDARIAEQRNMKRMEQFPPEFDTGDSRRMDVRLPNHVYNVLKRHSVEEMKRGQKLHEKKEYSTTEMAVDAKTRLILYKLVNGGTLESVEGVISSGKESVVFHATGGCMPNALVPEECAIKVFKTTLSSFKNRCDYVRGDTRFMKDEFKKQNPRIVIKIWAEKELANLRKMENSGIPCPRAVVLKKHVLVMEFLGSDHKPAPKLRDAGLSPEDLQCAYEQCIRNMKRMYEKCSLVHADLSEYNMLWHNDVLYFIDVAQAVDVMHPHAMEFLLRDCSNVSEFFKSAGVYGVMNKYDLFNDITGLNFGGSGKEFLSQVEQYEKNEEKLRMEKGKLYPFDYFFEKAMKEREGKHRKTKELFNDSSSDEDEDGLNLKVVEEKLVLEPTEVIPAMAKQDKAGPPCDSGNRDETNKIT